MRASSFLARRIAASQQSSRRKAATSTTVVTAATTRAEASSSSSFTASRRRSSSSSSSSSSIATPNGKNGATTIRFENLDDGSSENATSVLPHIVPVENGVPIHLFADEVEKDALDQLKILARSPIVVDYVAVMPDGTYPDQLTFESSPPHG
jgi:exo-beta-1,3-glucanase (GH17 family)